jgi:hypothetical protein
LSPTIAGSSDVMPPVTSRFSETPALDRADHDFFPEQYLARRLLDRVDKFARAGLVGKMLVCPAVVAGAKRAAGAAKQDRSRQRVTIGPVKGLRNVVDQLPVHRVQAVGAVQPNSRDLVADVVLHGLVAHVTLVRVRMDPIVVDWRQKIHIETLD